MLRFFLLTMVLLLGACSSSLPTDQEPEIVRVDSVVATVVAELDGRAPATTAPLATPAPAAIDSEAIVRAVVATIEPQIARQAETVRIAQSEAAALASQIDLETDLIDLYQRANPATVYIITSLGSGSGFLYGAEGYIVTNNHVVANSRVFEVVFAGGERRQGRLVGTDLDADLAVLQVDDLPASAEPLPLAEAGDVRVGQFVVAIGNPFGEQGSMSLGIVSGLDRSLRSQRAQGGYSLPQVIQTDAPINPGNSGGPLLNLAGEVVGVNSAIATTTGANSGVGFSIPVAAVRRIVPSLIERGSYEYPYLGITFLEELSLADQAALDLPQTQGAYVLEVVPGGPGDRAGIRAASGTGRRNGDLIVALDGQPVRDFSDLNGYLVFHTEVGQTVEATVLRDGAEITLPITLGTRP